MSYRMNDLYAVAEVAHHYLFNGALDLAHTLFAGAAAAAPDEAYFALALGLTHDRLGDRDEALVWYRRASKLDPSDGRADINGAELFVAEGRFDLARRLLFRGATKARRAGDRALERKAMVLLAHLAAGDAVGPATQRARLRPRR